MRLNQPAPRWQPKWLAGDESTQSNPSDLSRQSHQPPDAELLDAYSRAVIGVVEAIGPAVVSVARRRGLESDRAPSSARTAML